MLAKNYTKLFTKPFDSRDKLPIVRNRRLQLIKKLLHNWLPFNSKISNKNQIVKKIFFFDYNRTMSMKSTLRLKIF